MVLFVAAQFAGVVSSPFANASMKEGNVARHHVHNDNDHGAIHEHGDQQGGPAETCCALHAFFAGVIPAELTVPGTIKIGRRIAEYPTPVAVGITPKGLDRPPKLRL